MEDDKLMEMYGILKRIERDFYGNGQVGIKTRFERWEGSVKITAWIIPVLFTGVVAVVIKTFVLR